MKLTPQLLKNIVMEEVAKLKSDDLKDEKAKETDADSYADSLEKHIDFISALKIKESKLTKELKAVREQKAAAYKKIISAKR